MISKEELAEIKQERGTGLYYLEKEYFQYVFLNAVSKYGDNIVFKGGTCMKLCYGLKRSSEDLDFSSSFEVTKLKEIVRKCLKSFDLLGIEYFGLIEKEFKGNIRFEVRLKGPLFNGNLNSANNLKIDFNKNKVYNKTAVVVKQVFSDVPLFVVSALDEKEILAEKIRAIAKRRQARDLYDLWVLLGKGVEIDKKLIHKKLREEKVNLKNINFLSEEAYVQDLKRLIDFFPDYNQVRKKIVELFDELR